MESRCKPHHDGIFVMMRYLLLLFLFTFSFKLSAQQCIPLKINASGYLYSPDTNVIVSSFENGLAPFMIKGKDPFDFKQNRVGFIDSLGNVRIQPVYTNCSEFVNGQALVQDTSGYLNVINGSGKLILPAYYQWLSTCDNGMVFVWKNRRLGLFNAQGRQLLPPEKYTRFAAPPPLPFEGDDIQGGPRIFSWKHLSIKPAVNFTDFIAVQYNGLWGVINRAGVEVIPPQFDEIGVFSGNVAIAVKNKKRGLIDNKGNWLVAPIYDKAVVTPYKSVLITIGKKMGVLSVNNKIIIPVIYDGVTQLTANAFQVYNEDKEHGGRYGVISNQGKVIIPVDKEQRITVFGNGFIVANYNDNKEGHHPYALYNQDGKRISDYTDGEEHLTEPVWSLGNTPQDSLKYFVFNKEKNKFAAYTDIVDYFKDSNQNPRLIYYKKNNHWGLLDQRGVEITRPIYNELKVGELSYGDLITFARYDNKWGVIDKKGKVLLNYEYDAYGEFKPGCYWFEKGGRCRLMLRSLRNLTELRYDKPNKFFAREYYSNADFIPVQENGKWGFLDNEGYGITPCIYDRFEIPQRNSNHIMPVMIGNKWGFLNKDFKLISFAKYDQQLQYYEHDGQQRPLFEVVKNGRAGLIDTSGREIVPCTYNYILATYGDGLIVTKDKLYGVINLNGSVLVNPEYDQIQMLDKEFDSGRLWYRIVKDQKIGLMDAKGQVRIPCIYTDIKFDRIGDFPSQKDTLWGMISLKNEVIIPFKYEEVRAIDWHKDTAKWVYKAKLNGKYGLLDAGNKVMFPFKYDNIDVSPTSYNDCSRRLIVVSANGKQGLLDWHGKTVLPLSFKGVYWQEHNFIVVGFDDKQGLLDLNGKQLLPPIYDFFNPYYFDGGYLISKSKKINVVSYDGRYIFDTDFDGYEPIPNHNGYLPVIKKGKYGLLDCDANLIYPCIYKKIHYEDLGYRLRTIIPEKF